jgi:RHS repeat-associated protein
VISPWQYISLNYRNADMNFLTTNKSNYSETCTGRAWYGFNGKEKDDELFGSGNSCDFVERMLDSRTGRWLTTDPKTKKFPSISPYAYVANSPIWAIDPDGNDIIVLSNPDAVGGLGHAAVLVGNDKTGWTLYSKNGTYGSVSGSKSSGEANKNPQNGIFVGSLDNFAKNYNIQPDATIEYKGAFRITSSPEIDAKMSSAASKQVGSWYDVSGTISGSCIDVASDALKAGGFDPGFTTNETYMGVDGPVETKTLNPIPNIRYEEIKKNNDGTDATKSILPNQKDLQTAKDKYKSEQKKEQEQNTKAVDKQLKDAPTNPALDKRQGGGDL